MENEKKEIKIVKSVFDLPMSFVEILTLINTSCIIGFAMAIYLKH
jgi:hypothetical protein